MTILIAFHQSRYRDFKHYYLNHVCVNSREAFPKLPSYERFVQWMPSTLIPLCVYLKHCFGRCTGISFVDATKIQVCHNRRIGSHRVFRNLAARGKTSVDWFFGFKLHLVVNDFGELLNVHITPGNVNDRKPVLKLLQSLFGKVFALPWLCFSSHKREIAAGFCARVFCQAEKEHEESLNAASGQAIRASTLNYRDDY